jgi:subtilisin family serine protease
MEGLIAMKKLLTIITLLAILLAVVPAAAQTTSNRTVYVVLMAADPAAVYDGSITALEATRPGRGERLNPSSPAVAKYTDYLKQSHTSALRRGIPVNTKVYDYTYALNGFAAYLTENRPPLPGSPGWSSCGPTIAPYDHRPQPRLPGLDRPDGVWAQGYTGEGVVVGVIDTGIWPEHPRLPMTAAMLHHRFLSER